MYKLASRSGSAHALTSESIATLDAAVDGRPHGMAPAVALERTRDAVYGLNLAARLWDSAAAEHLAPLAGRRDVTSACCVGCGAVRKLKTCSKCRVARFCSMECTARVWPAHKASCKTWRAESALSGPARSPPPPAAGEAETDIGPPPSVPRERVWIEDATFKEGDAVVWFPRALAEMCADDAFKKELQLAGLFEGATKLAAREEAEVRGVVLDAQPPVRGCRVRSLVLQTIGAEESYAMPHVSPLVPVKFPQHIVRMELYNATVGKLSLGATVSVVFCPGDGKLRGDGTAVRGEVWEALVIGVDMSAGAYKSVQVLRRERCAQTGAFYIQDVHGSNAISPWQCEQSNQ
jgi:hypothetical protein